MASYDLLRNETTTYSSAPTSFPKAVEPWGPTNPTSPAQDQTFQLTITGTAGNVSGSAQVVASNDGVAWVAYGSAISVSSSYLTGAAGLNGTQPWRYYSAYLTAISGTGAKARLIMNA